MSYIYQTARVELERQVRRYAHLVKGNVLDVGASSFPRYKSLFPCKQYTTMDIQKGKGIDIVGSAEHIPCANDSFDSVVCTQVLGDVYEPRKAIDEFYRVLKKDGIAFLTESFFDSLHGEPHDYWRFTPYVFEELFRGAGFDIIALEKRGGFFSVKAQMNVRYLIEKYHIYDKWYRRWFSLFAKWHGSYMIWRDTRDASSAQNIFAHGWIIIAKKNI